MKAFYIFVLCVTVTWALPQPLPTHQVSDGNNLFFPDNNNNFNNGNSITTTAAPSNTGTVTSPQFISCLQSCPSTMEYNPICGTDNLNYHNNGRLSCAQRCGKKVDALRSGICTPQ